MTSALRLIMQSSKTERTTSSVVSAVWHVAPSCCNQMLALQFLWTKIRSTWPDNYRHWLQRPLLAHFRRNMAQLCLWTKIRTKQWLVLGTSAIQCMRAGFTVSQIRQFCLFTYPPRTKWTSSEKMIFWSKLASRSVAIFSSVVQEYTQPYACGISVPQM